jgi:hypothetical protein
MRTLKVFPPCWTVNAVLVTVLAATLAFGGMAVAQAAHGGLRPAAEVPSGLTAADWANLRGQIKASRYRAAPVGEGGYAAANPELGWAVAYRPDGTTQLTPRGSAAHGWRWGLRLSGYGYETLRRVDRPKSLAAGESSVTYAWDDTVAEWWLNTGAGLEQGFTIRRRPMGAGEARPLRRNSHGAATSSRRRPARVSHSPRRTALPPSPTPACGPGMPMGEICPPAWLWLATPSPCSSRTRRRPIL